MRHRGSSFLLPLILPATLPWLFLTRVLGLLSGLLVGVLPLLAALVTLLVLLIALIRIILVHKLPPRGSVVIDGSGPTARGEATFLAAPQQTSTRRTPCVHFCARDFVLSVYFAMMDCR